MNGRTLKVKDHPGLYRDPNSKAIIVDDPVGRKTYQQQRLTVSKSLSAVDSLKEEINNIREEMGELKMMIKDIATHFRNQS